MGSLALLAGLSFLVFGALKKRDAGVPLYARVEENGRCVTVLPLSEDSEYLFRTADGTGENRIAVRNGRVLVTAADCPDKVCMDMGEKAEEGDTIVCLPHRMTVTITRESGKNLTNGAEAVK